MVQETEFGGDQDEGAELRGNGGRDSTSTIGDELLAPGRDPMTAQQFMGALLGKLPEFIQNEDELRAL